MISTGSVRKCDTGKTNGSGSAKRLRLNNHFNASPSVEDRIRFRKLTMASA